jgi:hypothetical protein
MKYLIYIIPELFVSSLISKSTPNLATPLLRPERRDSGSGIGYLPPSASRLNTYSFTVGNTSTTSIPYAESDVARTDIDVPRDSSETPTDPVWNNPVGDAIVEVAPEEREQIPTTCYQRVSNYLTPFNTAMVMLGTAFVAGVGFAVAQDDAQNGNYAGNNFVVGTALQAVGELGVLASVALHATRNPPTGGLPGAVMQGLVMCMGFTAAGAAGYGVGRVSKTVYGLFSAV